MAKVLGIGGVILYSKEPKRLTEWYKKHLGIDVGTGTYTFFYWREKDNPEKIGKTLWEVVPPESNNHKIDAKTSTVIVSFRVDNLQEVLSNLRQDGVEVLEEVREVNDGTLGWFFDIDGNKVELWEYKEKG